MENGNPFYTVFTLFTTQHFIFTQNRDKLFWCSIPSSEVASARLPSAAGHWAPAVSPDRLAAVLKTLQTQIHGLFLFHKLFIGRLDEEMMAPACLPWWGWSETQWRICILAARGHGTWIMSIRFWSPDFEYFRVKMAKVLTWTETPLSKVSPKSASALQKSV